MKKYNTSDRLKQILSERNLKQVDILRLAEPFCKKYSIKLNKNDLSQYISGKVEPGQNKLYILGLALNVNEVWLMGFDDVPMERNRNININETDIESKPTLHSASDKIRYYRNQAGLSVEELAEASGISASNLKRYESGITLPNNLNEIHQLAKILNIDPIMLLPNDDALSQKAADSGSFGIMQPKSEENHYKNILLSNYNALNEQGKKKLIDYSDDLVGNIKYTEKQTK